MAISLAGGASRQQRLCERRTLADQASDHQDQNRGQDARTDWVREGAEGVRKQHALARR